MDDKSALPPYSFEAPPGPDPAPPKCRFRGGRAAGFRRSRVLKFVTVACLALIVLSQWKQAWHVQRKAPLLSLEQLNADLQTCKKLHHKPQDPVGLGRERNARYIDGGRPTLIKNATIWVGEPVKGTSEADARAGKGWEWVSGDVLLERGLIQKVEAHIAASSLSDDAVVFDAAGRLLTSGIIDMHSHTGVDPMPAMRGTSDTNEMSDNITPWTRSLDAIHPFDTQIQTIKSGGVTTSLVLPGSGNNIGGEAFLLKHAVGKRDGREEVSAVDMLADPDRNWRYMKMACGENAKKAHGRIGNRPFSRMGESYEFRHAFERARDNIRKQDDWCAKAEALGVQSMDEYLPQEIFWESLSAALRGQVHINTHCYTVPDLEAMVDHTNEFKFPVRAFHHAHQTFLVPEILRRTWGGRAPSSAIFADNMYYKAESYIGSEYAGKYLYDQGLTPIYVSDNPVLNAQHVLFEAAKGYHWGLPYHAALASVTTAPADDLGMGNRLGKIKPGFDADIVVWDSDPLSVGATPVQVWIDGAAQFDDAVELEKSHTGPMQPNEELGNIVDEPTAFQDALFSGVTKVLLDDEVKEASAGKPFNVAITGGKVTCIGECRSELAAASKQNTKVIALKNGHIHKALTGVAGTLGLNEVDAEQSTGNGNSEDFSRAIDGLRLEGKKLHSAAKHGVTRAISAPNQSGKGSPFGVSVGFVTTAKTSLEDGAVFASDAAVHYTLDDHTVSTGSLSGAFGSLRAKLLKAIKPKESPEPYTEAAYLEDVVQGKKTLALTIESADGIATALRVKKEVEAANDGRKIHMAIMGGSESHLVADELAAARVGVILTPLLAVGRSWDTRRTLTGAPLTNGTVVDVLVAAGVTVGVGLQEDWTAMHLGLDAGWAWRNGNGKISEKAALDLVSDNVYKILGLDVPGGHADGHFVVSEGSPLEIGSRIKAVGSGRGQVDLFI